MKAVSLYTVTSTVLSLILLFHKSDAIRHEYFLALMMEISDPQRCCTRNTVLPETVK